MTRHRPWDSRWTKIQGCGVEVDRRISCRRTEKMRSLKRNSQ